MSWEAVSCWIEHHPGLASWVQAVGSIGALLIAIWIASSQRRDQVKAEHERVTLMENHIRSLAERARRAVAFENFELVNLSSRLNLISGLRHSLDSINLLDLPAVRLLEPVSTLRDGLRALEGGMTEAKEAQYLNAWLTTTSAIVSIALVKASSNQILGDK